MRSLVLYNVAKIAVAATIPGSCSFPGQGSMVAVRTNGKNAGWAMHSDQECKPGTYCPYACPPGQLMAQWDPSATSYTYPGSRNGGLYCDQSGNLQKSFPDKPYCYQGKGTVSAKNSAGGQVAFCQTVLPGDEEMLIPTVVGSGSSQTLAVPGPEYWAGTAAHYYVNPPGVGADEGCAWGSEDKAVGNWAPYVAGMNQDSDGNTFVTLGWNPKFLEIGKPKPDFGLKISCADGDCAGTPCAIDPGNGGENEVSGSQSKGAGGASFCVVTAKNGAKAVIELFSAGSDKSKREEHHMHRAHDDQLDDRPLTVFASTSGSAIDEGVTSLAINSSKPTSYHMHHSYKQEEIGNRVCTTTFNQSA